jgi:hypothetical protein
MRKTTRMLALDHERRFIQGPTYNKDLVLREAGGRRIFERPPTSLDQVAPGHGLVVVFENVAFHAALWVQTRRDLLAALNALDARPRRFYEVPLEAFPPAPALEPAVEF